MSKPAVIRFEPRKKPVQARSAASVQAILQATVQVLLKDGRARLTTTRIAHRAGVSVGTLYQYFPNKSSLLQALLQHHLDQVALAVEAACQAARGAPLDAMAQAITAAFVQAKFSHVDISAALYAVSDDVEGKRIAHGMHARSSKAMAALFQTAPNQPISQPDLVAATLLSAMAGVSRSMLERAVIRTTMATMQEQLTTLARSYLEASAAPNACPHVSKPDPETLVSPKAKPKRRTLIVVLAFALTCSPRLTGFGGGAFLCLADQAPGCGSRQNEYPILIRSVYR